MRKVLVFLAVGGLFGAACGDVGRAGGTGDLAVQVNLPKVYPALGELSYQVARGASVLASQEMALQPGATQTSALFVGLPVAGAYDVTVDGVTNDGGTLCTGGGRSAVAEHVTTALTLTLTCMPAPAGAHIVTTFACSQISSVTAAPTTTSVGGRVALRSEVTPTDAEITSFQWTASSGTVSEPRAALTTFVCAQAGTATIELVTTRGACSDRVALSVKCVGAAP